MEYQVWTKDEYTGWDKKDCGDLAAAQREILEAMKQGKEPLLTVEVPYNFNIKIMEGSIGEVKKGKTKPGKGPGVEGDGQVRRGDEADTQGLNQGSGDNSADNLSGD